MPKWAGACARIGPFPPIFVRRGTTSMLMLRPPEAAKTFSEKARSVLTREYSVDERRSETACKIVSTKPSKPATTRHATPCNGGLWSESRSVSNAMTTDPDEIRAQIDAVLAELPDPGDVDNAPADADLEELARRLSDAHDMLVQALESAEKG